MHKYTFYKGVSSDGLDNVHRLGIRLIRTLWNWLERLGDCTLWESIRNEYHCNHWTSQLSIQMMYTYTLTYKYTISFLFHTRIKENQTLVGLVFSNDTYFDWTFYFFRKWWIHLYPQSNVSWKSQMFNRRLAPLEMTDYQCSNAQSLLS